MFDPSITSIQQFDQWSQDYKPDALDRIEKEWVHKEQETNVLVSRVEAIANMEDCFASQVAVDLEHGFFYEHPLDHIPGLLLIESGRQIGTVISHQFYDVGFDTVFVLDKLTTQFTGFAENNRPIFGVSKFADQVYKSSRLLSMSQEGWFYQDGKKVAYMRGEWTFVPKRLFNRLRAKKSPFVAQSTAA